MSSFNPTLTVDTNLRRSSSGSAENSPRASASDSPVFCMPIAFQPFTRSFSQKFDDGLFLGKPSPESPSIVNSAHGRLRAVSKFICSGPESLEPSPEALHRTHTAAAGFFRLAAAHCQSTHSDFPLAGHNKCFGMIAVPHSKLVLIAVSQDKIPERDISVRAQLFKFIEAINSKTVEWVFELVAVPTREAYLLPRSLHMRFPMQAPAAIVEPHTRCIEVALMSALCKIGRSKPMAPQDLGVVAYGGALWSSPTGSEAVPGFGGEDAARNRKYLISDPLDIELEGGSHGYLDPWKPCGNHCAVFRREMQAISAAGGAATHFLEPRGSYDVFPLAFTAAIEYSRPSGT